MTGNASYQQFGVEAMMSSSCFVGGGVVGADAPVFHVPEYTPHDGGFGFGEAADVAARFFADDAAALAGQLQLVRAVAPPSVAPDETRGAYDVAAGESCGAVRSALPAAPVYGRSPSDVTVAHPPQCSWGNEPCYPTWFSGGGFPDPFAVATSGVSLRLRAESSSAGTVDMSMADQSSEVSCSGLTHASSNPGRGVFQPSYGGGGGGGTGVGDDMRQMARPGRPHFSQVLSRSGYAHIAQQTLDEFVGRLLQEVAGITGAGVGGEASCLLPSSSCSKTTPPSSQSMFPSSEEHAHHKPRNDLLKLLQLVDQRCNQCLDEIQSAASKYGSMVRPGGGGGGLSAPFAHRAVSAMHRRLRARIIGEMAAATRRAEPSSSSSSSLADRERSWESAFIQKHWALRQLRRGDQQSWRPQRGLPEKSVAVLKAWMFENFLRPYPKDNEKEMLAARSGLSRSQVHFLAFSMA
ncbi:hypothetical protein ACP70R_044280 [Stipagrostis hirtigluma subsp. patula]